MTDKNDHDDGGSAFPTPETEPYPDPGMTLLDFFAATLPETAFGRETNMTVAKKRYSWAAAMVVEKRRLERLAAEHRKQQTARGD